MIKRGIILTVLIIAGTTLGSFMIWLEPQQMNKSSISNLKNNTNNINEIYNVISKYVVVEFENLLKDSIIPSEYIKIANISSSQINSLSIRLISIENNADYIYITDINKFNKLNEFLYETIVIANLIQEINNENGEKIKTVLEVINKLKKDI